jgi:hypothetical protein
MTGTPEAIATNAAYVLSTSKPKKFNFSNEWFYKLTDATGTVFGTTSAVFSRMMEEKRIVTAPNGNLVMVSSRGFVICAEEDRAFLVPRDFVADDPSSLLPPLPPIPDPTPTSILAADVTPALRDAVPMLALPPIPDAVPMPPLPPIPDAIPPTPTLPPIPDPPTSAADDSSTAPLPPIPDPPAPVADDSSMPPLPPIPDPAPINRSTSDLPPIPDPAAENQPVSQTPDDPTAAAEPPS